MIKAKKKLSLLFTFILIFTLATSTVAFAVEVETNDIDNEIDNSVALVDDTGDLDGEAVGETDGGESNETSGDGNNGGSEPDVTPTPEVTPTPIPESSPEASEPTPEPTPEVTPTPTPETTTEPSESVSEPSESVISLDGATVNVSQESVEAIANAVAATSDYQTVSNKNGYSVPLYDVIPDVWDSYSYHAIFKGGNGYWYYMFGNSEMTVNGNTGAWNNSSYRAEWNGSTLTVRSINSGLGVKASNMYYSDFDLYKTDGTLLWESDVPVAYTINFETGFDDLVIDSVSSTGFVAPEITYDGYKFAGWYFDSEYTLPYSNDFVFVSNTTLYAKWIPYRTVSFVTNIEGYEITPVLTLSGEGYYIPSFAYSGYEFIGAFTDEEMTEQFVDGTVIDSNITLYLKFSPVVYDMGALLTEQVELTKGLSIIQSQLWIILVVGLLHYIYKFFRIFF